MTDKQIIIDGVDVSGCSCYVSTGECTNKNIYPDRCGVYSNCTYKLEQQLKHKEQECERLKKEVEFYTAPVKLGDYKPITLIMEELDQLKAENKHLNNLLNQALKELEELQNLKDEDSLRVVILARENEQLKNRINNLVCSENCYKYKEAQSYKQAIEKIKEICTKYKEICANCEGDGYIDCIDCTEGGEAQAAIKVLQICDEVNDENNA